eukprot:540926_1
MTLVEQICHGLGNYYKSLNRKYDRLFSVYCDDNGLDDDAVIEELEQDPEDCVLVDFDEAFPFKKPTQDKQQFIFDLIRLLKINPETKFYGDDIPIITSEHFRSITEDDINEVKKVYSAQCPVLWSGNMQDDGAFLQMLTVGHIAKFDFLGCLVDDYSRDRIKHIDDKILWTEEQWVKFSKHFEKLKDLKVRIVTKQAKDPKKAASAKPDEIIEMVTKYQHVPYKEIASAAVKSFSARCCPKLLLNPFIRINGSLENTIENIHFVLGKVGVLMHKQHVLPFQIDLCIATGAPKRVDLPNIGDDDDDDDDDDNAADDEKKSEQKEENWVDCIGNIEAKLKKNHLTYNRVKLKVDEGTGRRPLRHLFDVEWFQPHRRRHIVFADNRAKDFEDVWLYEPPANCRYVPSDAVAEWHINASRTCLLPDLEYGDGKKAADANKVQTPRMETVSMLTKSNIEASFHCKGSLLTFSFIVKEQDQIKCYLYWNGQTIRFMPEDVKIILPRIFNLDYGDNNNYFNKIQSGSEWTDVDKFIEQMTLILVDKQFTQFRQSYM